jgi:spore germination protein KC
MKRSVLARIIRIGVMGAVMSGGLTGCWDRREVNDIAIISGMAVDKIDGVYRVAVQFPLAGQLGGPGGGGGGTGGAKSWYVDSGSGSTLKEADFKLQRSLSRQLYYSHRRVVVIGEEAARDGISSQLDITVRTSQNRLSALVVFAKGEAIDVLNSDAILEQQPAEMLREITINSMKNPPNIKNLINTLVTTGIDVAAPYYVTGKTVVGEKGETKTRVTVEGLAIFKEDRLVGFLKGETAKGVLWVMNQARHPIMTVKSPSGKGNFSLQFFENDVKLEPVIRGDEVSMKVKIRAIATVYENQSNYKASDDNLQKLTEVVTAQLKKDVEKSIQVIQGYKSDVCGFGDTVFRKKPKVWKRIKNNWYDIYASMKVDVQVDLQLEHAGTAIEPAAKSREVMVD